MQNNDFLSWHFRDNKFVELRHQTNIGWVTYWFDNSDDLMKKVDELSWVGNLFINVNRPHEITNKPITNDGIKLHTRLLFDLDPIRPTGTSSTNEELEASRAVAIRLIEHFTALAWPVPLKAISGNGAHIQYRTFLPNNPETKEMLKTLYVGLKKEFSTETVDFDPTVRNAGRIVALYGTTKRKGISTNERPHRRSIVLIPDDWKQVSPKQVELLANYYQKQVTSQFKPRTNTKTRINGKGDYKSLDAVSMFNAHGLYLQEVESGKHYVTCPWSAEHSSTKPKDTVVWESSGDSWPTFHCSHAHCDGRNMQDVIQIFGDADSFCSQEFQGTTNET